MNKNIHFIITGGTIDSVFSPAKDAVIVNDHSEVANYLNKAINPRMEFTTETLTLKDSREITDNIRNEIVSSIKQCEKSSIIITHGTYTMPETARYIKDALEEAHDKTIVLTGSMQPLIGFSESDAPYNLGYAISAAQFLDPGVYLAMNSYIFEADSVAKDIEKAVFVEAK